MDRYQKLLEAYAARDQLVLILAGIVLGILLARYVITRNPLGLNEKWQGIAILLWDGYILLAFVGMFAYSLLGLG